MNLASVKKFAKQLEKDLFKGVEFLFTDKGSSYHLNYVDGHANR